MRKKPRDKRPSDKRPHKGIVKNVNPLADIIAMDPDEFRVPAHDHNRQSIRVWAHIQPKHNRQIEAYLTGRDLPYVTKADLIRHAIKNHLAWLRSLPLPVYSVWGQAQLILRVSRDRVEEIEFEKVFKEVSVTVGKYMAQDNFTDAKTYLNLMAEYIRDMNNRPLKERYKDQFTSQFGVYMRATNSEDLIDVIHAPAPKLIKGLEEEE